MICYYKDPFGNEWWFDDSFISLQNFIDTYFKQRYLHNDKGPSYKDALTGQVAFHLKGYKYNIKDWLNIVDLTNEEKIAIKLEYSGNSFRVSYLEQTIYDLLNKTEKFGDQ